MKPDSTALDILPEGDHAPAPAVSAAGKSRPLFAQFMIFLNGIILTATAFVTLSIFISNMKAGEFKADAERVQIALAGQLELLERDMDLLKPLVISTPSQQLSPMLRMRLLDGLSRASFIAYEDNLRNQPMHVLYDRADSDVQASALLPVLRSLAAKTPPVSSGFATSVMSDPGTGQPLIFLIATPYSHGNATAGTIIVALEGSALINWDAFQKQHPDIRSLTIKDAGTGVNLAAFSDDKKPSHEFDFNISLGGHNWTTTAGFGGFGAGRTILSLVPVFMLVFGVTLTAIGVLYVRNNQRQTRRLQEMNTLLRDKNRDIKKQMERTEQLYGSLRASERDFAAVINAVNEVIFETDPTGRIVFMNDAWLRLTGHDPDDTLGRSLFEYIHVQDGEEPTEALNDIFKNRRDNFRAFVRILTIDGKQRFVELMFSLTRMDEAGNQRLVGMMTDIEERRQAEIALRDAERRYRTIVENAVSGLFQVGGDGHFISGNPALAKLLGYGSVQELLQDPTCNKNTLFADPKDRDLLLRLVRRQGQVRTFEVKYRKQDGTTFWVSENLRAVYDQSGDVLYYEGAIDDITQRKEAEMAMQKARLESDLANRAKTEFLANMSHELRTPLNAIIGFSDIIHQQSLGVIGNDAYLDYAREINAGGKQLLKIINEILDVSRIELSESPDTEGAIDLRKICETCLSLVRGKGEDKLISIESALPPQLPIIVGADTAFKQMILNLLHNAISHTPQGGQIAIETVLDQDHSVRLSVSDNGIGMDPEDVRSALQPLDGSVPDDGHTRKMFGLSLVRSLIEMHNGRLEIISEKGVGTTATLVIPAGRVVGVLDKAGNSIFGSLPS